AARGRDLRRWMAGRHQLAEELCRNSVRILMATVAISPDQDTIFAEIFIAAPPARVFEAITNPKQMPLWWGQQDIHRITAWKADLRPGGKWSGAGAHADGTPFTIEGEYLEVDPPRLLV